MDPSGGRPPVWADYHPPPFMASLSNLLREGKVPSPLWGEGKVGNPAKGGGEEEIW